MQMNETQISAAREMFASGLRFRQIAARLGLRPTEIKKLAEREYWGPEPVVDWAAVRQSHESGASLRQIQQETGISYATLRRRKARENWCMQETDGLMTMRLAVHTLETAIQMIAPDDIAQLARLGTALSMAGYRLGRAELAHKAMDGKTGATAPQDFGPQVDQWRQEISDWLARAQERQQAQSASITG